MAGDQTAGIRGGSLVQSVPNLGSSGLPVLEPPRQVC
jgi:hypothetical protein